VCVGYWFEEFGRPADPREYSFRSLGLLFDPETGAREKPNSDRKTPYSDDDDPGFTRSCNAVLRGIYHASPKCILQYHSTF